MSRCQGIVILLLPKKLLPILLLPASIGVVFYYSLSPWWLENLGSFYPYLGFYYLCWSLFALVLGSWKEAAFFFLCAGIWVWLTLPNTLKHKECSQTISLLQFNLFYENTKVDWFVDIVARTTADLLVLQEVSPLHGHKLDSLKHIYPYTYGGQPTVGYPSGQMLLSRQPLYGTNVLTTPNGHKIIQTVWRVREGVDVLVIALHPPSPRNEELWFQRNAVINTAIKLAERSPLETTLLVGDFNLASTTRRYRDISSNFQSVPVNTWPVFLKSWNIPVWPLVALDHLFLSSVEKSARICSRETLSEVKGSDHYPVLTKISLE